MSQEDAIAALDSGQIQPAASGIPIPDTGVRAIPDEIVERMFSPSPVRSPPWFGELAELVADKLKAVIRAEVRAVMREQKKATGDGYRHRT